MTEIPSSLKKIKPFIAMSNAMSNDPTKIANVIVAYYCRFYAVQLALKLAPKEPYILELMDRLETDKTSESVSGLSEEDAKVA